MAWRREGDKPLSEAILVSLLTHKCVTRPRWVKEINGALYMVSSISLLRGMTDESLTCAGWRKLLIIILSVHVYTIYITKHTHGLAFILIFCFEYIKIHWNGNVFWWNLLHCLRRKLTSGAANVENYMKTNIFILFRPFFGTRDENFIRDLISRREITQNTEKYVRNLLWNCSRVNSTGLH